MQKLNPSWLLFVKRRALRQPFRMSVGDRRLKSLVFDMLDSDGDGLLSVEDLRSLNLSLEDSREVMSEAGNTF